VVTPLVTECGVRGAAQGDRASRGRLRSAAITHGGPRRDTWGDEGEESSNPTATAIHLQRWLKRAPGCGGVTGAAGLISRLSRGQFVGRRLVHQCPPSFVTVQPPGTAGRGAHVGSVAWQGSASSAGVQARPPTTSLQAQLGPNRRAGECLMRPAVSAFSGPRGETLANRSLNTAQSTPSPRPPRPPDPGDQGLCSERARGVASSSGV
jgi:hypothetical protein